MLNKLASKKYSQVYAIIIFLFLICLIGFFVRMIPAYTHPQIGYSFDRAFHLRMAIEVLHRGFVPPVDTLSIYPTGKEITPQLPTFMYYFTVYFHKFLKLFSDIKINLSCDYFSALSGALIAIPVYFISLSLYKNKLISLLAALIAVIIPGHFRRTFCYWYKYEGIGTLLFLFSLQFFIQSLASRGTFKNILYGFLSAFSLLLLFATWRLAILLFFIYFLFGALLLLLNKLDKKAEISLSLISALTFLSSIFITYLSRNKFYSSKIFLFSLSVLISTYLIKYIYNNYLIAKKYKLIINFLILLATTLVLFSFAAPTSYTNFQSLFFIKLASLFGKEIPAEGINKVLLFTQELRAISLAEIFGPEIYSYTVFFILLVPFALFLKIKRYPSQNCFSLNLVFLVFLTTVFISSVLFFRNKVLASPLLAILAGGTIAYPLKVVYEKKDNKMLIISLFFLILASAVVLQTVHEIFSIAVKMARKNRFSLFHSLGLVLQGKNSLLIHVHLFLSFIALIVSSILFAKNYTRKDKLLLSSVFTLILSLFFLFRTGHDVTMMATRTVNKFAPEPLVISWIKKNIKKGTVLMTYWGQGYTTQLYTGCPTLTDGFLESPEIRKRIMEIETAFYSQNEKDLYAICKKYETKYIILPIFKTQAMAKTAGVDYRLYEDWGKRKATPLGLKTVLFKMIYAPQRLRKFRMKFKTKMYRILAVK